MDTNVNQEIKAYINLKVNILTISSAIIGAIAIFNQNGNNSIFIKLSVTSLTLSLLLGFLQVLTESNANIWEAIFDNQNKIINDFSNMKVKDPDIYKIFKKHHENLIANYRKRTTTLLENIVNFLHLNADRMETLFFFLFILGFVFLLGSIFA